MVLALEANMMEFGVSSKMDDIVNASLIRREDDASIFGKVSDDVFRHIKTYLQSKKWVHCGVRCDAKEVRCMDDEFQHIWVEAKVLEVYDPSTVRVGFRYWATHFCFWLPITCIEPAMTHVTPWRARACHQHKIVDVMLIHSGRRRWYPGRIVEYVPPKNGDDDPTITAVRLFRHGRFDDNLHPITNQDYVAPRSTHVRNTDPALIRMMLIDSL